MRITRLRFLRLAATVLLATASGAGATVLDPVGAHDLVKRTELIFEGVVSDLQYRVSDVESKDDVALPHTFVTFEIEKTFKGSSAAGRVITLRFEGGPDPERDEILVVHGVPRFDLGERAVVFVEKNSASTCPVTGWEQGRFRVVDGYVFAEGGQEVWLTTSNQLVFGKTVLLDEMLTHVVDGTPFVLDVGPSEPWTPSVGIRRASSPEFRKVLSALVKKYFTAEQLAALKPVPSASPKDPLVVKEEKPVPPPAN
ncbi:MAG: hypothetical protein ACREQ9_17020 [Candidatus Binatia bacterium]